MCWHCNTQTHIKTNICTCVRAHTHTCTQPLPHTCMHAHTDTNIHGTVSKDGNKEGIERVKDVPGRRNSPPKGYPWRSVWLVHNINKGIEIMVDAGKVHPSWS